MSSPAKQDCCVCGEFSTMRCSACAKAGVDLYFCSTEHQKLVWFAHKPVCGPGKADFVVFPPLGRAETQLLQSPVLRQLLLQGDAPDSLARPLVDAISKFEALYELPNGMFVQNLPRFNEWLDSLPPLAELRVALRLLINTVLFAFVVLTDKGGSLALPAHAEAITWCSCSRVTPELVRANLERTLQAIQDDLDLSMDVTGGGFLDLASSPLKTVPVLAGLGVHL
ncbi:hypothetical protein JCM3774_001608 [Rhodotorula dairenensis]